jgi:hypothetical protein
MLVAMPAIINAALYAGTNGAALSGSGPSILALCAGPTAAVAEAMQEAWARRVGAASMTTRPTPDGVNASSASEAPASASSEMARAEGDEKHHAGPRALVVAFGVSCTGIDHDV